MLHVVKSKSSLSGSVLPKHLFHCYFRSRTSNARAGQEARQGALPQMLGFTSFFSRNKSTLEVLSLQHNKEDLDYITDPCYHYTTKLVKFWDGRFQMVLIFWNCVSIDYYHKRLKWVACIFGKKIHLPWRNAGGKKIKERKIKIKIKKWPTGLVVNRQ